MSENKKIAKNSIILYTRLLITSVIGLYTTRLILIHLGADDYGLYIVVGGIVAIMNFMNATMTSTSNRFIAVELGKTKNNNYNSVNSTFNSLLTIHIIFGILLYVLAEVIGIWYINNHLNVQIGKIPDAIYVLRLSTLTAVISTISVPYQGVITINEKFLVRASVETLNSVLNLTAVLLLALHSGNKLHIYANYILITRIILSGIYYVYCTIKYKNIVQWKFNYKLENYKEISSFFSWQTVSVIGSLGASQGGAIIINIFFGTTINAAFGIATKVNQIIYSFVKNLNQAALPQIIKNYSAGNQSRSLELIYKLSKYTFFIMLIPAMPIILSVNPILTIWLKEVPEYTSWFVILRIIHGLVSCLESGFDSIIDATGKIKKTKIVFSILFISILPIVYYLYKIEFPPYTIAVLYIIFETIFLIFQTNILAKLTEFNVAIYLRQTILPVSFVTILLLPQFLLNRIFSDAIYSIIPISLFSIILTIITVYTIGLNKLEKKVIINIIKRNNPINIKTI